MKYAHIVGWGSYLPHRILTNDELAETIDTNDEWVYSRTGIHQRHVADEEETTGTLAFEAAARALVVAKLAPAKVELIIVATSTPTHVFPSTACYVQDYLGAGRAGAFDLSAACSGFVYALTMAAQAIATGSVDNAIVIGAETMTRVLDWQDRNTCILFGDGAGAVVLKGSSVPGGVLASSMRSDGSGGNLLNLPNVYRNPVPTLDKEFTAGGPQKNTIDMNGRQVFRFATRVIPDILEDVLKKAGLTTDQLDLIVPHQANVRIIESAARKLKIPMEKFVVNVDKAANTSAASIPIALCEAIKEGRVKPDQNIAFVGFGGGLTWAASVVQWNAMPPDEAPLLDREWKRLRYHLARGRSRFRQFGREVTGILSRYPFGDKLLDEKKKTKKKE